MDWFWVARFLALGFAVLNCFTAALPFFCRTEKLVATMRCLPDLLQVGSLIRSKPMNPSRLLG